MIAKLTGKIIEKFPTSTILETGGVGFEILISSRTYEKLPEVGCRATLEIYTHLRAEEIRLIGFLDKDAKEFFLKLISVSGISVKIALSSLSIYSSDELKKMIAGKEVDLVRRIPGIGKKLAERLIVELKDKLEESEIPGAYFKDYEGSEKVGEVREALKTLGYSSYEINNVLNKIKIGEILNKKTEEILKLVLKEI
jgi:Holliday junction DNA helicase RuvA